MMVELSSLHLSRHEAQAHLETEGLGRGKKSPSGKLLQNCLLYSFFHPLLKYLVLVPAGNRVLGQKRHWSDPM